MSHIIDAVKAMAVIIPVALGTRCAHDESAAIRPCGAGSYVNGVTPAGMYRCRPVLGDPERDIVDAVSQLALDGDAETYGLIYCTGGATPRQDGSSVWCQR